MPKNSCADAKIRLFTQMRKEKLSKPSANNINAIRTVAAYQICDIHGMREAGWRSVS